MSTHVEPHNRYAGQGAVLLDIGGDVGALVVTMPPELLGDEVEVRPAGADRPWVAGEGAVHGPSHRHPHVAVVERPVAGGAVPSLVFPELAAGTYELVLKGTHDVRLAVRIRGGEVTNALWP